MGMTDQEKKAMETLAKALKTLPESKKEYLAGFLDGVTSMAGQPIQPGA